MKRFSSVLLLLICGIALIANYSLADSQEPLEQGAFPATTSKNESSFINGSRPLPVDEAFQLSITPVNETTLNVRWFITDGYYLYKDKLSFVSEGAIVSNVSYPKSTTKNDDFFGQVEVYEKPIEVLLTLENIEKELVILTIGYQGCWTGGVCYPPQKVEIKTSFANPAYSTTGQSGSLSIEELEINELFQQGGLALFLGALLAGLALSWTPCVYPMIPILSGIIIGQKQIPSKARAISMSLTFVVSMSLAYGLIGASAGYFGAGINLQSIMQTPWVLFIFSFIFLLLAFSMFGYYDIQLPAKLHNKINQISNQQKGGVFFGVAVMGFLSALIVGPCVTPFLATALSYVIAGGSAIKGGISLFAMGLGMGIPILIVCGLGVNALPKPGPWMETIKHTFGFIMIAIAFYLLDRILPSLVSLILWAGLLTIAPIVLGVFRQLSTTKRLWFLFIKTIGLIVFAYGVLLWLLVAKGGGDIREHLESLSFGNFEQTIEHVQFQTVESEQQLDLAVANTISSKQTIALKYYADWCTSCKKLEKTVFSDPEVIGRLKNMLTLQIDVTYNNAVTQALLAKFGVVGPPALLFFDNGRELRSYRIIGEKGFNKLLKKIEDLKK
ncbi:MAG: protein-disulfide reductase DsbD [Candidatus Thioglobus sp.]|jgi:thiol:disulfide interchange protein DsbD|nr:protein-disulfide reductase DsbD [Candidatus Thioglobus sp.]|tara:strand:- start:807 stop:2645 length:1839 start_codon:yes stop_codon:yes gene_type:complete